MNELLRQELQKRLFSILKQKNNSSSYTSDELKNLTNLLSELNSSNYRNIWIPDLIFCTSIVSITAIIITFLIKLL